MGTDKALLDWKGNTLLDHMTILLAGVSDTVQVVGRNRLPDMVPGLGPIGGIATVLKTSTSEHNLVVAVDLPLLTKEFLKYFKDRFFVSAHALVICNIHSKFPLCLGIRRSSRGSLEKYIGSGRRSLRGYILETSSEIIGEDELAEEGFDSSLFLNVNTPASYRAALDNRPS